MSIPPSIAFAAIPAVRIASESVKVAMNAGLDFASHLLERSSPEPLTNEDKPALLSSPTHRLERLVPRLQQFLRSLGAQDQTLEIRTDSQGNLEVDGDPGLKQSVSQWIHENSDWTEAWQAAARDFLAASPTLSGSDYLSQGEHRFPSLRSKISPTSAEHWAQTH